jgi:nucleoside-diphosphate-sugar epimerase
MGNSCKRALLTGATGYVGSRLANYLVTAGWSVIAIVRPESNLSLLNHATSATNQWVHDGTTSGLIELVRAARPDVVFHLASRYITHHQSVQIDELIASNVLFGTQLVEAMIVAECKYLINAGTSWQHFSGETYHPVNLYAATKQAFEDIVCYYVESTELRAITLELFDTYGPDDPRGKIVSLLCLAAINQHPLALSVGEQLLELVHIDDVVAAFVRAAEILMNCTAAQEIEKERHQRYSVRPQQAIRLRDLAGLIEQVSGCSLNIDWGARPYRPREVMIPESPYPTPPGWAPNVSLDQGLRRLISILRDNSHTSC